MLVMRVLKFFPNISLIRRNRQLRFPVYCPRLYSLGVIQPFLHSLPYSGSWPNFVLQFSPRILLVLSNHAPGSPCLCIELAPFPLCAPHEFLECIPHLSLRIARVNEALNMRTESLSFEFC